MFLFGISKTFGALILRFGDYTPVKLMMVLMYFFSRVLCGALNGNSGVIKSMMIDITDSTNMAQAFGFLPIPWMTGNTLG
jgi:hypothetical protein